MCNTTLLDKCNFDIKNFRNYLDFESGKIDPVVEYYKFQKVDEQFFICANCYFKKKKCDIVDILVSNFENNKYKGK